MKPSNSFDVREVTFQVASEAASSEVLSERHPRGSTASYAFSQDRPLGSGIAHLDSGRSVFGVLTLAFAGLARFGAGAICSIHVLRPYR